MWWPPPKSRASAAGRRIDHTFFSTPNSLPAKTCQRSLRQHDKAKRGLVHVWVRGSRWVVACTGARRPKGPK